MKEPTPARETTTFTSSRGQADEIHQTSETSVLTTNQGLPISDDQSSLRIGARGPTLLEDFVLREKITHFDHERIPERIVHARGSGAHGYFELSTSMKQWTRADFLQREGERIPVFARFSTVAGGAGSVDVPRDIRGFAIKLYTHEGNFDIVGNNVPVFFIQDAIKFPDLIHAVKMEPDRGFPQAGSAHATFWDFISLTPESTHTILWAMSDRALPRSLRMIEGFGVHTFRFVDAAGDSTFVKFHFRPRLGLQSVLWDEAVQINGADNDYHRRDLWESIEAGDFPEWDFCVQIFTEAQAKDFDFDVLDPTKLLPEEIVPLQKIGRIVLDRNPDSFFAETEQVAFCPANIVPGIDFSNDPLLQGRLFSYLDTQLSRLGGPNSHEIPINAPKCPFQNFQRDGHMRTAPQKGRVAYEPNTLAPASPRESPERGFQTFLRTEGGGALRVRPESFADHYTQPRLFWRSQSEVEQNHIVSALVFELSKVEVPAIRERVIANLVHVDASLADRIARGLGLAATPAASAAKVQARDMAPSPALGLIGKAKATIEGRDIACLVTDGVDRTLVSALGEAVRAQGGKLTVIAPKIGGVRGGDGGPIAAGAALSGAPSVLFDAVVLALGPGGGATLAREAAAVDFVRNAFGHLKVIGFTAASMPLLDAAGLAWKGDAGFIDLGGEGAVAAFVEAAKRGRLWAREPLLRSSP